jgi:hypothetical protein
MNLPQTPRQRQQQLGDLQEVVSEHHNPGELRILSPRSFWRPCWPLSSNLQVRARVRKREEITHRIPAGLARESPSLEFARFLVFASCYSAALRFARPCYSRVIVA